MIGQDGWPIGQARAVLLAAVGGSHRGMAKLEACGGEDGSRKKELEELDLGESKIGELVYTDRIFGIQNGNSCFYRLADVS